MTICTICKIDKPIEDFYYDRRRNRPYARCSSCHVTLCQGWQLLNKSVIKQTHLKRSFRHKSIVVNHYSNGTNGCACCGETLIEFLAVDHPLGNGGEHRRKINKSGNVFYGWLIAQGLPDGYRILCHNCNQAMGNLGGCPHTSETIYSQFK